MNRFTEIGPSSRSRASHHTYKKYLATQGGNADCAFCSDDQVLVKKTFKTFRLLGNRFKYDVWDDYEVIEHLMLAPLRHVSMISELNDPEKAEYLDLLGRYEAEGYSIYSRAPVDLTRSADHLHTHLIKLGKHQAKAMIYVRKPHLVKYLFGKKQ